MINRLKSRPSILILLFLLLQLAGQTAAGFSGRSSGLINIYTVVSYICLILRAFIWLFILKLLPLTKAYPYTAAVYILILPLSILIFGESPDWSRYAGAGLIFIGIMLNAAGTAGNV